MEPARWPNILQDNGTTIFSDATKENNKQNNSNSLQYMEKIAF